MKRWLIPIIVFGLLLLGGTLVFLSRNGQPHIRIMPLGDSITQGAADADSYRRSLWKLLKKGSPRVDFVGSMKMNHPDARPVHSDFDIDHEGHWGWRTDEVLAKIDGWARQAQPDIVLLHLGTNDIAQRQENEDTAEELRRIIIILRKHNPRVEILLAQLIPMAGKTADMRIQELNRILPGMAQSITTDESPVHIVNQYEGFDAFKDTDDGIHPNESGIKKMAQKWYRALVPLLKLET